MGAADSLAGLATVATAALPTAAVTLFRCRIMGHAEFFLVVLGSLCLCLFFMMHLMLGQDGGSRVQYWLGSSLVQDGLGRRGGSRVQLRRGGGIHGRQTLLLVVVQYNCIALFFVIKVNHNVSTFNIGNNVTLFFVTFNNINIGIYSSGICDDTIEMERIQLGNNLLLMLYEFMCNVLLLEYELSSGVFDCSSVGVDIRNGEGRNGNNGETEFHDCIVSYYWIVISIIDQLAGDCDCCFCFF
mmetsp:Transcript_4303/g.9747  ORF Transcript_4303/g.9747 Transcript_4303/m.9747 type:complete len:242 (-) Transcript_4303:30-755(-)